MGPDHHQYPTELVELLNRINACLADRYRRDFETGMTRERVERASFESVLATDPSEGVHASQILPLTYQYFHVVDRRDYGGTVLRPLFSRILRSWNFDDVKDQTVARLIVLLEQEMIARGALPTHNAVVVARPRLRPRPPLNGGELERIAYVDWPGLQGDARFT